jgi:hypothetical protein
MSFKITKLTVGKGKTTSDEKAGEWNKRYYEIEILIEDEHDVEIAKASVEGLIDGWLTGTSVVEPQAQPQLEKPKWNPEKIQWVEKTGAKGAYQQSEDLNNTEFKMMLKDLAEHKGFLYRNGFNYWIFKNGSTVGRKRRS